MSRVWRGVLVSVMALALVLAANLAWAVNPNVVVPPHAKPGAQTYGEWGFDWWQWVLNAPIATFPLFDPDGTFTRMNQAGSVFFLAGNWGGTDVRDVSVAAGKDLFFPVVNGILIYPEDVPPGLSPQEAEDVMRDTFNSVFGSWPEADLVCVVDGVALKNLRLYRGQSPASALYLPANSAAVTDFGYAGGWHNPSLSDGYWVMLAPLSTGQHKIQFKAVSLGIDITYNVTVVGQHKH